MYTTSSATIRARRAPSAATLRFLYQLAYISSGTALGVGALCAEERRRRTQVVQRIADNAKRIRQSERYYSNAAAAAVAASEDAAGVGFRWGSEAAESRYRGRMRRRTGVEERDKDEEIRGPELPSVVEEEYQRSVGRGSRRRRRSNGGKKEEGKQEMVVAGTGDAGRRSRQDMREMKRPVDGIRESRIENKGSGLRGADVRLAGLPQNGSFESYKAQKMLNSDGKEPTTVRARPLAREFMHAKATTTQSKSMSLQEVAATFRTRAMWSDESGLKTPARVTISDSLATISDTKRSKEDCHTDTRALSNDLDRFFTFVSDASGPAMMLDHAVQIAKELQSLAIGMGSMEDIRSLIMWRLAVGRLSKDDFSDICAAAPNLASRLDWKGLATLYLDIFATKQFKTLDDKFKIRCITQVLAENVKWRDDSNLLVPSSQFAAHIQSETQSRSPWLAHRFCDHLLSEGLLEPAVELFCVFQTLPNTFGGLDELGDKILAAALASEKLPLCARVLRQEDVPVHLCRWGYADQFFQACERAQAYEMIIDCFKDPRYTSRERGRLSENGRVALCIALASTSSSPSTFNAEFRRLPPDAQRKVADASIASKLASIKSRWQATHNIQLAEAEFEAITQQTLREHTSAEIARLLAFTKTEIYLSATKTDLAAQALSEVRGSAPDHQLEILAALTFAKQGKWNSLLDLVDLLVAREMRPSWTTTTHRNLNHVIHLFAIQHDLKQTFDLLKVLINRLGLIPSMATSQIVMQKVVSSGSMDWMSNWKGLLASRGIDFHVDEELTALMLKRYYLDHRPSHVMMMWFGRTLQTHMSKPLTGDLSDVVRESIAFDQRHFVSSNPAQQAQDALARYKAMENSDGTIPRPGYTWNGKLYGKDDSWSEVLEMDGYSWLPDFDFCDIQALERAIVRHFALDELDKVLEICQRSRDAQGLPASSRILEVAVRASLRMRNGSTVEAKALLDSAQEAGMNITCAEGPMLMHRMKAQANWDWMDIADLRDEVISYYRAMHENGWPAGPQVGVVAAHCLRGAKHSKMAINLLDDLFHFDAAGYLPLDITAMTVHLQCYSTMGSGKDIDRVVKTVLDQNMLIDHRFINALQDARRQLDRGATPSAHVKILGRRLVELRQMCIERRREQKRAAYLYGKKVVHHICMCASESYRTSYHQKRRRWAQRIPQAERDITSRRTRTGRQHSEMASRLSAVGE